MRFRAATALLTSAMLVVAAAVVTACGGGDAENRPPPRGPVNAAGSLIATGFGQEGRYVWATALVHNDSDQVGQTVIVEFNATDASGHSVGTNDQVEAFSRLDQLLAVGALVDVGPNVQIATVQATLTVQDEGIFAAAPFPELKTTPVEIGPSIFGGRAATFELMNSTDQPLMIPRVGVICHDSGGGIIGGGSNYPDFVPASGTVYVECRIITSGDPAGCEVFVGAPI